MNIKKLIKSVVLLLILFAGTAWSNTVSDGKNSEKEKRIVKFAQTCMDAYQIPGLAIAVVENNEMIFAKAFGVKNLDTQEPVTIHSIFHMASVSKPFAATAVMQLVEKGKMKLDDPLIRYLPYFKLDDPRYRDITIKQMLTHTSGIPDVEDYEWDKQQFDDGAAERYVRSLADKKMIAAPGEKAQYSNMAFDILADVIAKVSGMPFEDYIKKNILDPLDMKDSDFLRKRIKPELRTSAHVFDLQPVVSEVYPYNRRHAPSSCLNASVVEMCNWAIANLNHGAFKKKRILDASSYQLLFEPQVQADENLAVGLSWFLGKYGEFKTIGHTGGDLGFRSIIVMLPEKSLAVIAASNYQNTPMQEVAFGVLDIMLGLESEPPKKQIMVTLGRTIAEQGVQAAVDQYRKLKDSQPDAYNFQESQLNNLGYQLIRLDRLEDAIEFFKLNVEMYPDASNPYDSLGEAYMKSGQNELAIQFYKKSLELNPENTNAIRMLERLEGEAEK